MSDSVVDDPAGCLLLGQCSPIQLLSVGPFDRIEHGDSVSVDVAFVGGEDQPAFQVHADYAQFAHDVHYQLPSAPPSPRVLVEAGTQHAEVWWDDSPEFASDPTSPAPGGRDFEGYRVYLGLDQQEPVRLAQFDLRDTTGFNTGLEGALAPVPLVRDGVTYRYHHRIDGLKDGFRYWGAVTSYDTGDQSIESLESNIGQNKFLVVPSANADEHPGVIVFPEPIPRRGGVGHWPAATRQGRVVQRVAKSLHGAYLYSGWRPSSLESDAPRPIRAGLLSSCCCSPTRLAQDRGAISGKVTDKKTGHALPFATVTVVGRRSGGLTDSEGQFLHRRRAGRHLRGEGPVPGLQARDPARRGGGRGQDDVPSTSSSRTSSCTRRRRSR